MKTEKVRANRNMKGVRVQFTRSNVNKNVTDKETMEQMIEKVMEVKQN